MVLPGQHLVVVVLPDRHQVVVVVLTGQHLLLMVLLPGQLLGGRKEGLGRPGQAGQDNRPNSQSDERRQSVHIHHSWVSENNEPCRYETADCRNHDLPNHANCVDYHRRPDQANKKTKKLTCVAARFHTWDRKVTAPRAWCGWVGVKLTSAMQ